MAHLGLGEVGNPGNCQAGLRDAIHVPIVIAYSAQALRPGDHVRFTDDKFTTVVKDTTGNPHAIVDPFIKNLNKGAFFNVILFPGTMANLTHHYEMTIDDVPKIVQEEEDEEEEDYYDGCRGCW